MEVSSSSPIISLAKNNKAVVTVESISDSALTADVPVLLVLDHEHVRVNR